MRIFSARELGLVVTIIALTGISVVIVPSSLAQPTSATTNATTNTTMDNKEKKLKAAPLLLLLTMFQMLSWAVFSHMEKGKIWNQT